MDLTQKFKILKNIYPREKWLQETREFFLIQAKEKLVFKKHKNNIFEFIPLNNKHLTGFAFLRLFLKPIGAFGLIAILLFGSSAFAFETTKNTVPGDPLYVIKINLEKTQKMLTNNKEKRVELAINSSSERLKELKKLSHSNFSIKNDKNIKIATQNLNEGIKEIKVSLNDLKEELDSKTTVETAKTVDAQTIKYEKELIQTKKESSPLIKEEIEKVLNSVEETSSHALQTIINEQEITKEDSVLKNEATNIIENKIKQTEEKIEEVKNKAIDLAEVSKLEISIENAQGGGQIDQIDLQKIKETKEPQKQETQPEINSPLNNKDTKKENKNKEIVDQQKIEIIKVEEDKSKIIDQQKIKENIKENKENKEKSKEIIKETNKAEEILKEVKESLKQKDLNKVDLNIIADKVAVSKKLTNIANKVADKAINQKNKKTKKQ
ncbi:MAG: hypothetical protein ABH808_01625 [Candidatus Kuenenbacteria bacterium]